MSDVNFENHPIDQLTPQEIAERCSAFLQANDGCAETLDISIDSVGPGTAELSMKVSERYANGYGFCQGGIITTLADTAFAHASNSYNQVTVAQGLSVDFVRPAVIGDTLTAIASEQFRGRLTGVYEIKVVNSKKKLVAIMSGKSFSLEKNVI